MEAALVTGAGGFCAGHLIRRLRAEGLRVTGIGRGPEAPAGAPLDEYLQADLTSAGAVRAALRQFRPDLVFHLAAVTRGDPRAIYHVNVLGTAHLLEALREQAPDARTVLVGSAAEYGPAEAGSLPLTEEHACAPAGAYGISKHAATLMGLDYARRQGMRVVVARPFNIVGAGIRPGLLVGDLLHRAREALQLPDPVIRVGNLGVRRDFVAAGCVAEAYLLLARGDWWGEVFNLCSGEAISVGDVVQALLAHAPRPIRCETDPALVRPAETPVLYGSPDRAGRAFGFRPGGLTEALREAWECAMRAPCH